MKLLLLNGHGISLRVDGAKLCIRDGMTSSDVEPEMFVFRPKRIDIENIIIYGRTGNISLDAVRWLVKHGVQITLLDWNGKLLTTMLPPEAVQIKAKFCQYEAYKDKEVRIKIARKFLEAKFQRTQAVLDWLKQRYSVVDEDFSKELPLFRKAREIKDLILIEGRIASHYWSQIIKIIPEKYEFESRKYQKRPWGAGDAINCMLNYGYAILESECLRAINSSGLDPHIGFLHEANPGKNSLAYDLQEPFRFLIDLSIINLIENKRLEKSDFIRTENYTMRLRPSGAKKVLQEIDAQFNRKTHYKGQLWSWRYIILDKATELSHHLQTKREELNFMTENQKLERIDNEDVREKILKIKYQEWKKQGFSKGTLHYMKQNAKSDKPFTLNKHVKERLEEVF